MKGRVLVPRPKGERLVKGMGRTGALRLRRTTLGIELKFYGPRGGYKGCVHISVQELLRAIRDLVADRLKHTWVIREIGTNLRGEQSDA